MVIGGAGGGDDVFFDKLGGRRGCGEQAAQDLTANGMGERGEAFEVFRPLFVADEVSGALPLIGISALADVDVASEDDGAIGKLLVGREGVNEPVGRILCGWLGRGR